MKIEVLSEDEDSDSSDSKSEIANSATEISTDSEFQDDPTPTSEVPAILLNDFRIEKKISLELPRKIQVTGGFLQQPKIQVLRNQPPNIELELTPLKQTQVLQDVKKPSEFPYALNRTQSTGGIATKVSLELKKKYLLGGTENAFSGGGGGGGLAAIQKSGSASTLDTKFKNFRSNISDIQKLLKPASVQTSCEKIEEQLSIEDEVRNSSSKTVVEPSKNVPDVIQDIQVFQNESEGRPRSPPHETSLIVPKMNWSRTSRPEEVDEETSTSSSTSSSSTDDENENAALPNFKDSIKSVNGSEKKELNLPKTLPGLQAGYKIIINENEEANSGNSTPVSVNTEMSDWARDTNNVSDFEGLETGLNIDENPVESPKQLSHICGRDSVNSSSNFVVKMPSLSANFDSLEFMDTESCSEEESIGYNLLKNNDNEEMLDSLEVVKNAGYCKLANNNFGGEVIELKSNDLERLKLNQKLTEREEDSLIVIENNTVTTTEENSDSTIKNVTEIPVDVTKKRLEEKLSQIKKEKEKEEKESLFKFDQHCLRLQSSKIDFGNAKDSIDIRKNRKSKEEVNFKDITLNLTPTIAVKTPEQIYKKEIIEKERNVNQKLVQEMVMSKMKLLESKRKNRKIDQQTGIGLQKSQTTPNMIEEIVTIPKSTPNGGGGVEKLRNEARARVKMLTNEELGLSPEDKVLKLREKYTEFKLYSATPTSSISTSNFVPSLKFRPLSEYNNNSSQSNCDESERGKLCRSDSNLLLDNEKRSSPKRGLKFTKIMDLFSKKSPKGLFSKFSPKSKEKITRENRVKSFPEDLGGGAARSSSPEIPPPVPPLPTFYMEQLLSKNSGESSDEDFIKKNSCETLNDSMSSLGSKNRHRKSRRSVREAQLKRHRMAQEIQRKLEETEVKTRELEERGVTIEKTLRGENRQGEDDGKKESVLLQEWFDIMRDRTELRRYEKELMIRAQELELEDRHARLQHQLRKRLKDEKKSEQDKQTDCKILNEMLEIASKRDSLNRLLEEDRLRYLNEDRDFEEQMLSKDLHLTPNGEK